MFANTSNKQMQHEASSDNLLKVHDMKRTFITLEQSFNYVGDNSKFQKTVMVILSFQWFFYSCFVMGMPILFQPAHFKCLEPDNSYQSCSEEFVCQWVKQDPSKIINNNQFKIIGQSLAQEFQLFCEKRYLLFMSASCYFVGMCIAGITLSFLAGLIGRRKLLMSSLLLGSIAIFLIGFSPNIHFFIPIIFVAGFGMCCFETGVYVYITEISARRFRNISGNVLFIIWAVAQLIYPFVEYEIKNWREICSYGIGLPLMLSTFLIQKIFYESPRFLVAKQRFQKAREVFEQISLFNDRPAYKFHLLEELEQYNSCLTKIRHRESIIRIKNERQEKSLKGQLRVKHRANFIDFFVHASLRRYTLILLFFWFIRYFIYYGIAFSLSNIGGEIHFNFFFLGIAEVISAIISTPIKIKMRRLPILRICLVSLAILPLFLFLFEIPKDCLYRGETIQICLEELLTLFISILIKFSITFFAVILMTYTSELYPTIVRSQGYGLCMTFGNIGSIFVPMYTAYMQMTNQVHPLSFFCILASAGYLLTFLLIETRDVDMQDYLQEDQLEDRLLEDRDGFIIEL